MLVEIPELYTFNPFLSKAVAGLPIYSAEEFIQSKMD